MSWKASSAKFETNTGTKKLCSNQRVLNLTVCVAALGYFVDVFDLFLFSILRVRSLKDLGIGDADSLQMGHAFE
jgi:hypothetical protein